MCDIQMKAMHYSLAPNALLLDQEGLFLEKKIT